MPEASTLPTTAPLPSCRLDSLETSLQTTDETCTVAQEVPAVDVGIIFRHAGWIGRRECVDAALESIDETENRLSRFRSCGRNCWVLQCLSEPDLYRTICDKCRDRFCTPCAMDRSRSVAASVAAYAVDRELRFITLTMRKSTNPLADDINRIYRCFVRLRRRRLWTKSQKGGIGFLEIKRQSTGVGWHVHLHLLVEGHNIEHRDLSKAWHEITGDSFVVKIRWCATPAKAGWYAAKYSGKGVHGSCYHNPRLIREAILALRGRRLITKWGTWSELSLDRESDKADWIPIGSLAQLMHRHLDGDPIASAIIESFLGALSCSTQPRSPPDLGSSAPTCLKSHDVQGALSFSNLPF